MFHNSAIAQSADEKSVSRVAQTNRCWWNVFSLWIVIKPPNGLFPKLKTNADAKMGRWSAGSSNSKGSVAKKKLRRGGFVFFGCFRCQKLPNYIYGCMLPQIKGKTKASQLIRFPGPCYLPHFPRDVQIVQRFPTLALLYWDWVRDRPTFVSNVCSKQISRSRHSFELGMFARKKMGIKKEAGILFQTVKSQIQNIANIFHLQEFSQFTFSSILHIFT